LKSWDVSVTAPQGLERQVWRRIAQQNTLRHMALRWSEWAMQGLSRPVTAGALAAVVLTLAISAGYVQSRIAAHQAMEELSQQYVVSIDPLSRPQPIEPR